MSRRSDPTLAAGLCASLVVHGLLVFGGLTLYVRQLQDRLARPDEPAALPSVEVSRAAIDPPADEIPLGEATGVGTSIKSTDGDREQLARLAEDEQPFTSLDPAGFGKVGDRPSPSALPPGEGGTGAAVTFGIPQDAAPPVPKSPAAVASQRARAAAAAAMASKAQQEQRQQELPPPVQAADAPTEGPSVARPKADAPVDVRVPDDAVAMRTPVPPTPAPHSPTEAVTEPEPSTVPPAPDPAVVSATPTGGVAGAPGAPARSADPAPQADSEIDPFSPAGSVDFRPGRTSVQFGRRAKLTRPRLLLAGQYDLIGAASPRVTLAIRTSAKGHVTDVAIHRSSGSDNVDQPVKVAAYEWWFEPRLTPAGEPVADAFLFTVSFVGG